MLLLSRFMVSDFVWPHRRQPTRLLCPWDSPGKNTGVGCHFLLQFRISWPKMNVNNFQIICVCVRVSCLVVSDCLGQHGVQPTRLPRPWDSPGKNTGVGCHFFLQCREVKSESEVTQSRLTLCDSMDYSLPASSIYAVFQTRVLEWGAISFCIKLFVVS